MPQNNFVSQGWPFARGAALKELSTASGQASFDGASPQEASGHQFAVMIRAVDQVLDHDTSDKKSTEG